MMNDKENGITVQYTKTHGKELLSPREMTMLQGLLEGLTDREISALLGVSEKTVNSHMRHLIAKLGAKNRTHAVVQALREKLLQLEQVENMT